MNEIQLYNLDAIDHAPQLGIRTRGKYRREIEKYLLTGASLFDRRALVDYAEGLKSSSRAFFKAALRVITSDFEQDLKANVTPESLAETQAALLRMESLRASVTVHKSEGMKSHTWLTQKQVTAITKLCTDRRDWLVLGLLLGAGLRREELAALRYEDVKEQPMKSGEMRAVLEVKGKGEKTRVIPISKLLAERIGQGIGLIVNISAARVYQVVRRCGKKIGKPDLAPHDCRRTYAQLAYDAGIPITQISVLLGHANVTVTQRYLNLSLDLESTASDFIQLSA